MWKRKQCFYKNNNSSERCHGKNCKAEKQHEAILTQEQQKSKNLEIKRMVLDDCPKCKKETKFTYLRWKGKHKIYKCLECGAECKQISRSKQVVEPFAVLGGGHKF